MQFPGLRVSRGTVWQIVPRRQVRIRCACTGRKAVRFTGWQLVEAQGAIDTGRLRYDLAIYRSDVGKIIVELIARRRCLDEQDLSRVEIFESLVAASDWLEAYSCSDDIPVPASLADGDVPMALSVLQAVQLRQRIARIEGDYKDLLSDVFEALDITDSVAVETVDGDVV